jgi:alkylation response protein AidB-like acyl-CoA dehydrogenase
VNFDLSEDEEMLKALVERFIADRYDMDTRRKFLAEPVGFSAANWKMLGELGLIPALFGEESGGLGINASGIACLFEALGRGLVVEPIAENVILAAGLFEALAPVHLKTEWMPGLVTGTTRAAFAHREYAARKNSQWVETQAIPRGEGYLLSGEKSLVPAGSGVDFYLVSARRTDAPGDVSLFFVDTNAPGLTINSWRLIDGSVAVSLTFDSVTVDARHILNGGQADIDWAQSRASLACCAEALGIMETLFADTLTYLRTRKQFGVALGSFQALQHRMVAQYAVMEQARALLNLAMMDASADNIDGVRAYICEVGVTFGHEMIQMHGGMGVSDELNIGQGHKRMMMLSRWPDDAITVLDRFARV